MFVPISVDDPPQRIAAIIADCRPHVVLALPGIAQAPRGAKSPDEIAIPGEDPPPPVTVGHHAAYAIYTSGTTGVPKGVVIPRSSFAAAVASTIDALGLNNQSRSLCVSSFHFDGSYGNLFPTLAAGGSVVIPARDALTFPRFFLRVVKREDVTFTSFTPSYLRLLLSSSEMSALSKTALTIVSLGGEACSGPDIARLFELAPQLRVFNQYGPTETTIAVTHYEISRRSLAERIPIPIGRPHRGVDFHLVDDTGTVIDQSDLPGELYVSGNQLMTGYWNAPHLTAAVLREDVVSGQLVYRTGDLVTRDSHGIYTYVDRIDGYVKRNGFRVSLVELTAALSDLPGMAAAACATFDNDGHLGIVAFVVGRGHLSADEVRGFAYKRLPHYMVPDVFRVVDGVPLTASGKADTTRLLSSAHLRSFSRLSPTGGSLD